MRISLASRNLALLEFEQTEASKHAKDMQLNDRHAQEDAKVASLNGNQEAAALRGEAENIKSTMNAAAAALGVAAACCACIPIVGAAIAAILAAVAAILVLIGQLMAKSLEDQAAAKEKQAGLKDLESEQHKNKADDTKKEDQDRRVYLDQLREKLSELTREDQSNARF